MSADTLAGMHGCACLSGLHYDECCGPAHSGTVQSPTAERLMRSRYCAFVLGLADYLLQTWHPSTRPATLELDTSLRWYRLDILGRTRGGMLDTTGTVAFIAYYRDGSDRGTQQENSSFLKENGRWLYVSAV